jgi:hypothetical protein
MIGRFTEMNHKRIPNLGSKGWFLVAILVIMPIVSIYAVSDDTESKAAGVTVREIDFYLAPDSKYHTVSTLIKRDEQLFFIRGDGSKIKMEPYFLIEAGATKYFSDTDDYSIGGNDASFGIYGFYWNEQEKKTNCFPFNKETIMFLPKQILYDGRLLAITGKNKDRWDIQISEFLPGDVSLTGKRSFIVGDGEVNAIALDDGFLTVIFQQEKTTGIEVKLDVDKSSHYDRLITPQGVRTIDEMHAKQKQITETCRLTLRALGSTQLSYQELNSHSDFGTYWALENTGFIEKGYTRANLIENYSISVFNARISDKLPDGTYKPKSSKFQIIAVPKTKVYDLNIYGIGTDMNIYEFKNDIPNYWWWIKNKYMRDDPYDFGFNPVFWERVH